MKPFVGAVGLGAKGSGMAQSLRHAGFESTCAPTWLKPLRKVAAPPAPAPPSWPSAVSGWCRPWSTRRRPKTRFFGSGSAAAGLSPSSFFVIYFTANPHGSVALEQRLAATSLLEVTQAEAFAPIYVRLGYTPS